MRKVRMVPFCFPIFYIAYDFHGRHFCITWLENSDIGEMYSIGREETHFTVTLP